MHGHIYVTDIIDIKKLERENRKFLYTGLIIALFVCFDVWWLFAHMMFPDQIPKTVESVRKSIRVKLILIPPRLTEPLDIEKRESSVVSQTPTRTKIDVSWPGGKVPITKQPEFEVPPDHYVFELPDIVGELLRADLPPEIKAIIDPEHFTIDRIYQNMSILRDPLNRSFRISLKDEMISVEDLDKGRYKGLIVFSPGEEKKLEGFIYIPATISATYLAPPPFVRHTTTGLANALKKFTSITVNADINLRLDSRRLSKFPFVYIAADSQFELTEPEKKNFGEYLRNGGFAFLEAYGEVDPSMPPRGAMPMRQMLKDILGSKGQLIPIPNDHPLYHCFFDFDDGPPTTANPRFDRPGAQPPHYLEGIWLGDRLVVVYSEKEYGEKWNEVPVQNVFQKLGVNILVFVLIQPGGLTMKLYNDSPMTR